jgi:hypothetical protein
VLRFSDARNFGRTATGLLLFVGPALLLIAGVVSPDTDHKNKLAELNAIAAHKGSYLAGGLIWLAASVLLVFAAFGLIKLFRGPRGVTLGQVSGVLLALGSMVGVGWYAFGVVEYEMVNHNGLDRTQLALFLHKADSTATMIPLIVMFAVGIVLGLILLGVASIRTRAIPVWAGVVLIIGGPLAFFSEGKVSGIISGVVTLVGLGALGWRALSMSDEEWDAPLERKAVSPAAQAQGAPSPAPAA